MTHDSHIRGQLSMRERAARLMDGYDDRAAAQIRKLEPVVEEDPARIEMRLRNEAPCLLLSELPLDQIDHIVTLKAYPNPQFNWTLSVQIVHGARRLPKITNDRWAERGRPISLAQSADDVKVWLVNQLAAGFKRHHHPFYVIGQYGRQPPWIHEVIREHIEEGGALRHVAIYEH